MQSENLKLKLKKLSANAGKEIRNFEVFVRVPAVKILANILIILFCIQSLFIIQECLQNYPLANATTMPLILQRYDIVYEKCVKDDKSYFLNTYQTRENVELIQNQLMLFILGLMDQIKNFKMIFIDLNSTPVKKPLLADSKVESTYE